MPATLEDKQFQELNKSVKSIVKTLETAIGNTATQKAKKSEEEVLRELRMKNVKKEEELLKDKEKDDKENRVKLFDVATFMKASAVEYFDATKQDKLTWGNLFKSMKSGVKDWFDKASKQRTMLGRTLRLGASLWENTHKHLIQNIQRAWSKVTGMVNEVLG